MLETAQRLLDLLYPPRCAGCGARGIPLCASCRSRLTPLAPPLCARCGLPLHVAPDRDMRLCPECRFAPAFSAMRQVRVATAYESTAREVVHALKYGGQRRLAEPLGHLLAATFTREGMRADLIVPIPLHPERLRERGFNQADLLARVCARHLRLQLVTSALARVRPTPSQSHLPRDQRRHNVAGAFRLTSANVAAQLAGKRILLIDDVATTLSTLDAAATALLAANPAEVSGLAVARPIPRRDELHHV